MLNIFDPVYLSREENEFLLEALGKPTVVALRSCPSSVNPVAVKPILDRVNELEQLKEHDGIAWVGIEVIKNAIQAYLREDAKWAHDHKRTGGKAPRFPSLYSFDAKGRPHLGGPGSDSGHVRTYFGPAGERIPFETQLIPDNFAPWQAPGSETKTGPLSLKIDSITNRIECLVPTPEGVCGHTESYKAESRSSYNAARARMSKHLRKATVNVDGHREVHANEFS